MESLNRSVHFVWVRALNIALDSLGKLESQACQPTTQPKEPTQAHGEIPQAGPGLGLPLKPTEPLVEHPPQWFSPGYNFLSFADLRLQVVERREGYFHQFTAKVRLPHQSQSPLEETVLSLSGCMAPCSASLADISSR